MFQCLRPVVAEPNWPKNRLYLANVTTPLSPQPAIQLRPLHRYGSSSRKRRTCRGAFRQPILSSATIKSANPTQMWWCKASPSRQPRLDQISRPFLTMFADDPTALKIKVGRSAVGLFLLHLKVQMFLRLRRCDTNANSSMFGSPRRGPHISRITFQLHDLAVEPGKVGLPLSILRREFC
jgi:hypothetical protein